MTTSSHSRFFLSAIALLGATVPCAFLSPAFGQTRYTASWSSLDAHNPAPEWFQDAKFGIYYHWGAFGTPMFGDEWYPRNMMNKGQNSAAYKHHMDTYGDPYGDWGYDKFLKGANDKKGNFTQFAPKLKSAGGNWDPDEWAQMFFDAGARFAGPVAEHHDGFSMWDSKANEWNSVLLGPKLNLAKLHADAIRKKGMKLFMSLHHQWNFGGYWAYGTPTTSDKSLQKLYGKLSNVEEQTLWLDKLKEVIDAFLPDILYQDRYLSGISQTNLMTFLAYYYNAALDANKDVVAVAKETITDHKGQLYDYERGGPADIRTPYWMTDDSVGQQSWCYVTGLTYFSDAQIIGSFIDRVSKGGNMILNTSPLPDGTYPQRQKDIMAAFGKFLRQMGTAIFNTRAWVVYGEGPTKMGGGEFTSPTALTANDVRYTKSKDGDAVYAIFGGWPGNGKQVTLTAVTTSRFALGNGKVFLFGPTGGAAIELQATQDGSGLRVTMPSSQPYTAVAYAMKISKSGAVPAPTPWLDSPSNPDGGVPPTGGNNGSSDAGATRADGSPDGRGGASGSGGAISGGSGGSGTRPSSSLGGTGAGGGGSSSLGGANGSGGASKTGGVSVVSSPGGSSSSVASAGGGSGGGGGVSASGGGVGGAIVNSASATIKGSVGSAGNSGSGSSDSNGPTSSSSGCSCSMPGSRRTHAFGLATLGIAFVLLVRRRRS